jgi:hypothetical protein
MLKFISDFKSELVLKIHAVSSIEPFLTNKLLGEKRKKLYR